MYEILNHTADLAIKVQSNTVKGLFYKCAIALTDLLFGSQYLFRHTPYALRIMPLFSIQQKAGKITLQITANNKEDLLVEFLGELLFHSICKYRYFFDFKWKKFTEQEIIVDCLFHNLKAIDLKMDIKAVTYHNIKIKKDNNNFSVIITFDL
ncbi:MAG: hypothetical protein DRH57_00570 [Candidatus Cloacimonadota bacterium]|nr:MAG: hypothetical protein DRH57_00570 [Candidatus Cloacimonadota bacterium]